MPLLFNAFVAAHAGGRSHLGRAISAYASIADAALLDTFFKTIIKKLIKVRADTEAPTRVMNFKEWLHATQGKQVLEPHHPVQNSLS